MSITVVMYQDWSSVLEYITEDTNKLITAMTIGSIPLYERVRISSWPELKTWIRQDDIFADTTGTKLLVDFGVLTFDDTFTSVVGGLLDSDIVLYSANLEKILADEKRSLAKAGVEVIDLKKPSDTDKLSFLQAYSTYRNVSLSSSHSEAILHDAQFYSQIVDLVDLLIVSDNNELILQMQEKPEEIPLFFLSYNPIKIASWYNAITTIDQVQLGLAMLYTKAQKSKESSAHSALHEITKTDFQIKKGSGDALINWKLLLWKLKHY